MEAKKEYDIILTEMRDPDFKAQYGMEQVRSYLCAEQHCSLLRASSQLTAVKEIAKNQLSAADE